MEGNAVVGRYLADTLAVVPHFTQTDFERMFNDNVQVRTWRIDVGLGHRV